jgi:hypothetical protein
VPRFCRAVHRSGSTTDGVLWRGPDHEPLILDVPGQEFVFPQAVNDRGDVVGWANGPLGEQAIVWLAPDYEAVDITPPSARYAHAYDINDRRQVVGLVGAADNEWAFRWDPRTDRVVDLRGFGGTSARALGIDERGIAFGYAEIRSDERINHAAVFVTRPGRR